MADGNQENQWRRDLQQAQNNSTADDPPEGETPEESPEEENALPLQPELLSRNLDDDTIAEDPKSPKAEAAKMSQGLMEKIRSKNARRLLNAWLTICATGGLAFWAWLYVFFHYTLSYIGGPFANLFPKPGRELIKPFLDPLPLPQKLKKWAEEIYGSVLEKFELMFACCCCTSCLIPIIGIFLIIYALITPCSVLKDVAPTVRSALSFFGICSD